MIFKKSLQKIVAAFCLGFLFALPAAAQTSPIAGISNQEFKDIKNYMKKLMDDECFRNVYGSIPWHQGGAGAGSPDIVTAFIYAAKSPKHPYQEQWKNTESRHYRITDTWYSKAQRQELDKLFANEVRTFIIDRNVFNLYMCLRMDFCFGEGIKTNPKIDEAGFGKRMNEMINFAEKNGYLEKTLKISRAELESMVVVLKERVETNRAPYIIANPDGNERGGTAYLSCKAK